MLANIRWDQRFFPQISELCRFCRHLGIPFCRPELLIIFVMMQLRARINHSLVRGHDDEARISFHLIDNE